MHLPIRHQNTPLGVPWTYLGTGSPQKAAECLCYHHLVVLKYPLCACTFNKFFHNLLFTVCFFFISRDQITRRWISRIARLLFRSPGARADHIEVQVETARAQIGLQCSVSSGSLYTPCPIEIFQASKENRSETGDARMMSTHSVVQTADRNLNIDRGDRRNSTHNVLFVLLNGAINVSISTTC